jgi:DNA-binding transcriptional regulator YiaG
MVNLNTVLNDRIARIARKEIKSQTGTTRKAAVRYRSDIAALKRQVQQLTKRLAMMERQAPKATEEIPNEVPEGVRYGPRTAKALRARLGLSAKDFGRLVGVAGLTVYHWESGKARPRDAQLARLVAIRKIGRREALRRLEGPTGDGQATTTKPQSKRGQYKQTAEEFILSLVRSRKGISTPEINAAWSKAGRPARADYVLSKMLAAGKLKRKRIKGERSGTYSM